MNQMLTEWSQEYVDALFKSDKANDPLFGKFTFRSERDGFVDSIRNRFPDLDVEPLPDGLGVEIKGATADNLMEIVRAARQSGGQILFPGALPA